MKLGNFPLQSLGALDQLRERFRYMHYSLRTEQVYVYWVRFFIRWRGNKLADQALLNAKAIKPRLIGNNDVILWTLNEAITPSFTGNCIDLTCSNFDCERVVEFT